MRPITSAAAFVTGKGGGGRFRTAETMPPGCAGKSVQVAAADGQIVVPLGDAIIAEHRQAPESGQRIVEKEHLAELWKVSERQIQVPTGSRWQIDFEKDVQS